MLPCTATQGHLQGKLQQCSFGPEHPSPVRLRITHAVLIIPVIVALAPSSVIDPPLLENSTLQICLSTAAQSAMHTRSCNIINTCPQGGQIGPHQNSCALCSAHSWMNISFCSEVELKSLSSFIFLLLDVPALCQWFGFAGTVVHGLQVGKGQVINPVQW